MKQIDRYQIRESIASGGTGDVCVAFDPAIERTVVIKTLDRSKLPGVEASETISRFRREAMAAGRLTHPGIVTVYEYGEAGDLCFIAMEHAQGPTLREFLSRQSVPPLPVVLSIARQLFAALIYAHEQGVLHRDLKPGNIVLAGQGGDAGTWRAKILDFGIARINSAASVTQAGTIMGTPGYMAPEQYLGDPTDARADIYAMGVLLFELLTGQRTFQGDFAQVVDQVLTREPPKASSVRAGLPTGIDAVLAKALSRTPATRYATMREFREAFVRAMPQSAVQPEAAPALPPVAVHSPVQEVETLPLRANAARTQRPKLLLLDDEERILGALSALFRLKYEVISCTDGHAALDMVRRHKPEVIISDQRMPQMVGVEFLRLAREIDATSVRILLTGYSDLAAIVGSINEGEVFRFVNKPWSNQDLKDTVAQAMQIAQATRSAGGSHAPAPEPVATPQQRASEAVVVVQPGREVFDLVNAAFGRTRPVCHAPDVASALQAVEDEDVAVLVCDLDAITGADVMLRMLKQSHPRVQTVALADQSDADGLISLINEAQVLRFLNKPVKLGLLDRAVRSALAVHANCKVAPVLVQRQSVRARRDMAESSLGRHILERLTMWVRPAALAGAMRR